MRFYHWNVSIHDFFLFFEFNFMLMQIWHPHGRWRRLIDVGDGRWALSIGRSYSPSSEISLAHICNFRYIRSHSKGIYGQSPLIFYSYYFKGWQSKSLPKNRHHPRVWWPFSSYSFKNKCSARARKNNDKIMKTHTHSLDKSNIIRTFFTNFLQHESHLWHRNVVRGRNMNNDEIEKSIG